MIESVVHPQQQWKSVGYMQRMEEGQHFGSRSRPEMTHFVINLYLGLLEKNAS